jgi:8-oxo-dGTP diphosphatase
VASSRTIQAAGGLLWREEDAGISVAVVHRPAYDDWSLPKGKAHRGEPLVDAATREVAEETGASVDVSRRLGSVHYEVDGRRKTVRYWAMRYLDGQFAPSAEVDEVVWLDPEKARRLLTYRGDRNVVGAARDVSSLPTSVLVLVRHASAGKRSEWPGSDLLRPLDRAGRSQAKALAPLILAFKPVRIVSANPLRCLQTVEPLAASLDTTIEVAPAYSDEGFARHPDATSESITALIATDRTTVVCSQGEAIPGVINAAAGIHLRKSATVKGAMWVLGCRDGKVISADYYPPPSSRRGNADK